MSCTRIYGPIRVCFDLRPSEFQPSTSSGLCVSLKAHGLNERTEMCALPASLKSASNLASLWQEISLLLDRQQRTPKAKADDERRLREVALAPGRDNALWPFGDVFSADKATVDLFESLELGIPFLSSGGEFSSLIGLCPQFDAAAAVDALGAVETGKLEEEWQQKRLPLGAFVRVVRESSPTDSR